MGNKIKTIYVCGHCDAQFSKWNGRCLECGAWGSLRKEISDQAGAGKNEETVSPAAEIDLSGLKAADQPRFLTNIKEADRVLGGGIMPSSIVLLSGEPGIGKSTIVAQIADAVAKSAPVSYVSGEESPNQVKARFERLGFKNWENIRLITETNVEKILAAAAARRPKLLIVDSIQSVYTAAVAGEPGGLVQIRAAAVKFLEAAKNSDTAIILIGHITKDGAIAGPKSLEHIVDTVIHLESERTRDYRLLRTTKNRFGSTNEIGVFTMTGSGFEEVINPSQVFIGDAGEPAAGSVISSIIEGTRPFLVEIQALVSKTPFGYPVRKAAGYDSNRLQILSAVLTKRTKLNLANQDIILNIAGGLKVNDPAVDLPVCFAIASSLLNQVVDRRTIILGEVGLGGEIRRVGQIEARLKEAAKLGFTAAIVPAQNMKNSDIKITEVKSITSLIDLLTGQ